MERKLTAFGVYDYAEIIARFIRATVSLEGPSGYPVDIFFRAGNHTDPPGIALNIYETQADGSDQEVFHAVIDQDTTLQAFLAVEDRLSDAVMSILGATLEGKPYRQYMKELKESEAKAKAEDEIF